MRSVRLWAALALCVLAIGCSGDKLKRQPVAGKATYLSKPIQFGSARFEPAAGQATTASADIRNGSFSVPRSAGLSPGKYKVFVQAFDRIPELAPGAAPGSEGPPPKDILPQRYAVEPAADIEILIVGDDKPNEVTLNLK